MADRPGLVWFRKDLRLDDNPAWAAATAAHREVVAVFVLEDHLLRAAGARRRDQLLAHLHGLDAELRNRGAGLVAMTGPAVEAIPAALAQCEATGLYANADGSRFSSQRDEAVAAKVAVPIHWFHGTMVHEPGKVLTRKGTLSQVFTPFHKTWASTALTAWPVPGSGKPASIAGVGIPSPEGPVRHEPGETAAWERFTRWLDAVDDYPNTRDLPAIDGTSDVSADLKFGTISPRSIVDIVGTHSPGRQAFVRQLAWRDWWAHTLVLHPDLPVVARNENYRSVKWRDDPDEFARWTRGETGFPIVDAGMRQLQETGWMHNRVRMICASFLVKDLLVDWRKGERFFRHHLVDADIAQNAGNWQWVAGTGPDAAPYFRVFNPTTQSRKFDPSGEYIRRWVRELRSLNAQDIHEPSKLGPLELAAFEITLGDTYPYPIVDHRQARLRAIDAYQSR